MLRTIDSGQCQTDNATVTVYRDANGADKLEDDNRKSVNDAMNGEYEPTDLTIDIVETYVGSGGSETDIVFQETTVGGGPGGTIGYTWCNDPSDVFECDQFFVQMEAQYFGKGLACHEGGHAIGLAHGADASSGPGIGNSVWGCMRTPFSSSYTDLGANQVANINSEDWWRSWTRPGSGSLVEQLRRLCWQEASVSRSRRGMKARGRTQLQSWVKPRIAQPVGRQVTG
ncbi:hypothetical protein [Streptomyces sp. NPDC051218]|uniref:hypothetical protein n=1 Tax=Streptomyces sp. NPDC051218 TaxID=3365645 RepID=UPI0037BB6836